MESAVARVSVLPQDSVELQASSMKATWNDTVIVEGNHYCPNP